MGGRRTATGAALVAAVLVLVAVLAGCRAPARAVAPDPGPSTTTAPAPSPATPTPTSPTLTPTPTSRPTHLEVLGLGDSVTSGAHCDCTPFVEQLGALLAARDHVRADPVNLGTDGATVADLVQQLAEPDTRRQVAAADVVVVTIGANDLQPALDRWDSSPVSTGAEQTCVGGPDEATLDQVGADVGTVLEKVAALRAGRPTRVLVTEYWNVFEDGAVGAADRGTAYLRWSDALTRCLNRHLCTAAHAHQATCVDLYTAFKGDGRADPTSMLADDGDHPDAAGHALIARTLLAALPPAPALGG